MQYWHLFVPILVLLLGHIGLLLHVIQRLARIEQGFHDIDRRITKLEARQR